MPLPRPVWDDPHPGLEKGRDFSLLDEHYVWLTRGENCPVCEYMSGHIFPLSFWQSYMMPGKIHLGCNCYLQKVKTNIPANTPEAVFGMNAFSVYGFDVLKQFAHNFELLFQGRVFSNPAVTEVDRLMQAMQKTGSWWEAYDMVYSHPFWDTSLWGLTSLSMRIFQTVQRESASYIKPASANYYAIIADVGYQQYKTWALFGRLDTGELNYFRRFVGAWYRVLRARLPLLFGGFGGTYSATGRVLDPAPLIPTARAPITTTHYHRLGINDLENALDFRTY